LIAYRLIRRVVAACAWNMLLLQLAMATATDFAVPTETHPAHEMPLGLEAYEPNAFGYTKNNDDVHYENFKVSVEIQLMRLHTNDLNRAYFSFTGMFAFYIGDRESGPVVGQESNLPGSSSKPYGIKPMPRRMTASVADGTTSGSTQNSPFPAMIWAARSRCIRCSSTSSHMVSCREIRRNCTTGNIRRMPSPGGTWTE